MKDHLTREQTARLAALLREQLNEAMAAAHGLNKNRSENHADHLAVLNRSLYRQLRLVRHLELLYRLTDQTEIRLRSKPVDLVPLCSDFMEQAEGILTSINLTLSFHTTLTSLVTLADPRLLEDMILFLLSNSVHSVGEGGSINLTLTKHKDQILFVLSDSGDGPSIETLTQLFECPETPYEIPTEITMELGIPLVRQIAALHGGSVLSQNSVNKGFLFAVSIPTIPCDGPASFRSPLPDLAEDSWDRVLVELSDSLPARIYQHEELDS